MGSPSKAEYLWMSDKSQKQATAKAAWQLSAPIPAKLLVNVYRYHAMVKSVSCCCACIVAGFSPIQLHMLFFTENVLGYHIQSLFCFNKSSMKYFLCILAVQ